MHSRAGVDNKVSFLRFQRWCRQAPIFRGRKKCCFFLLLYFLKHFWPVSTQLRGHLALSTPFLRQILKFWSVGAALMRFTWVNISERTIIWNFSVTYSSLCEFHTSAWFLYVCALPWERLRRLHVVKNATQLSCIRWSAPNKSEFQPMTSITLDNGSPRSVVTFVTVDNKSPCFTMQLTLLHHGYFTFPIIHVVLLLGCHKLDAVHKSTPPQICNNSWSWRTSILQGAIFHEKKLLLVLLWCSLHGHRDILPQRLLPLGPRVLDVFLSSCCMKELGGFRRVIFPRLFISWRKLQLCPLPWFLTTAFFS